MCCLIEFLYVYFPTLLRFFISFLSMFCALLCFVATEPVKGPWDLEVPDIYSTKGGA